MDHTPLVRNDLDAISMHRPNGLRRHPSGTEPRGRMLDRAAPLGQSKGVLNIERSNRPTGNGLYYTDWVHTLLNRSTYQLSVLLFLVYLMTFLFLTPFWLLLSDTCGLYFKSCGEAFIFTVFTFTTVGYGVREEYLKGCVPGAMLLTVQQVYAMILNAIVLGGFWLRISRPHARASTIMFSSRAVVQEIRGKLYFMFQVVELRKHQLVEAHVRCYALRSSPTFCASTMRLQRPDDQTSGLVLLCLPVVVVHRIDTWSPLNPPPQPLPPRAPLRPVDERGGALSTATTTEGIPHDPSTQFLFPDIAQREADVESGDREDKSSAAAAAAGLPSSSSASPKACAEDEGTDPGSTTPGESPNDHHYHPPHGGVGLGGGGGNGTRRSLTSGTQPLSGEMERRKEAVREWLRRSGTEVLVVLEGEENMTGCSLQARHSYTLDDVEFDMTFAPCVSSKEDGGCVIDYAKFQELVKVSRDGAPGPYLDGFHSHA